MAAYRPDVTIGYYDTNEISANFQGPEPFLTSRNMVGPVNVKVNVNR